MLVPILIIQVITFILLGIYFLDLGDWRLGTAQLLLAIVQGIIYSGRMA